MSKPHIVILGGGPAGCGAACQLRRHDKAEVTLIERSHVVGGNAGSFQSQGQFLDYGSHRLHAACDPEILADLQRLMGNDLAHRERHGRIRLRGKWLHFPLKTTDLMLRLDRAFAIGAARDLVSRSLFGSGEEGESFASVLRANLGTTMCEHFYFPYARKLWGHEPEELSGIQAHKRVSAGSFAKILKRLVRPPGEGKFYYPRKGYGQITEVYAQEGERLGVKLMTGWTATRIERDPGDNARFSIEISDREGETRHIESDHIWSTIPVTLLCRMMSPAPPTEILNACSRITYRSMILVYLTLPVDQFTPTDAHYFPESHIRMTRMSEPKNYFGVTEPPGKTTLCAELPCEKDDETWNMSDEELGKLILEDMSAAELPVHQPVEVFTRRLPQAYPTYTMGYERDLGSIDSWVQNIPNVLVYGRQGLFAHDNTHHALYMAYAATHCMTADGNFDDRRWAEYREIFATHVVED
jgi:protoporphyrinogen oxidase